MCDHQRYHLYSGGTVSEEMRVALTTMDETPIATAEAENPSQQPV